MYNGGTNIKTAELAINVHMLMSFFFFLTRNINPEALFIDHNTEAFAALVQQPEQTTEGFLLKSIHISFVFATLMFGKDDLHQSIKWFTTTGLCSESSLLRRDK